MTKYEKIKNDLIQRIKRGDFSPLNQLPTEKELTEQYQVSRVTIRKSIELLEKSGLIYRRQGLGTFISQDKSSADNGHYISSGITHTIESKGFHCTSQTLIKEFTACPDDIAQNLDISPGHQVLLYKRFYSVDEHPLIVAHSYINTEYLPGIELYDYNFIGMSKAMNLVCPVNYHRQNGAVHAVLAGEDGKILQISPNEPVLCVSWSMTKPVNNVEIPVEYTILLQKQAENIPFLFDLKM